MAFRAVPRKGKEVTRVEHYGASCDLFRHSIKPPPLPHRHKAKVGSITYAEFIEGMRGLGCTMVTDYDFKTMLRDVYLSSQNKTTDDGYVPVPG